MSEPYQPDGIVSDTDLDDVLAEAEAANFTAGPPADPASAEPAAPVQDAAQPAAPATAPRTAAAPTQPAQPAAPAQAGPPWWQNVKDYKTFEESLATAPPVGREQPQARPAWQVHRQPVLRALPVLPASSRPARRCRPRRRQQAHRPGLHR